MRHYLSWRLGVQLTLVVMLLDSGPAHAWSHKGHAIQASVALSRLPADMPSFFRNAHDEMDWLISEPDRWRPRPVGDFAALEETTGSNHTFRWEIAPKPLPPNRNAFIIELAKEGKVDTTPGSVRKFGTSPYGIQEWAEMLTIAFHHWRVMPEKTPTEITQKRMQEKSILFIAAVLGHWITDSSNPIHVSRHVHGWDPAVPNPHGYAGHDDDPHHRYEHIYTNRVIQLSDVAALVDDKPRVVGDWLREAETYIAANNSHVEQIYAWDKQARFGDGHEVAAAKPFTAARLADGARELRDYWYTTWIRSGQPRPKKQKAVK